VDENQGFAKAIEEAAVLVKSDAEGENGGAALAEKFSVEGYPTFVLVNHDTETVARWWGYDDPDGFTRMLRTSASDPATIAERTARLQQTPTASDAVVLGRYHWTREEFAEAASFFEQAVELGDPEDGHEYELTMVKSRGVRDEIFTIDEVRIAADRALAAPGLEEGEIVDIAQTMASLLLADEPSAVLPYVEAAMEATEGSEDAELVKGRARLEVTHALATGDAERAVALKRATLDEGWEEDSEGLNSFAWWCFEHEVNLEEAEALARKGAELAEEAAAKAMILDTVAEIVNLRGDRDEAIALMKQAVELDPDNEYFQKQVSRFEGELAESM
jgi:tetratricopeptide (TPR) repeat protein